MPIPTVTRVLVADDHEIVRKGLKLVLSAEPDLDVVAEAADGEEAVRRSLQEDVDLAILDISMPRKTGADDDIVTACRAAMRGEPFLYPSAVHALIRDVITRADERREELELLTPRELEVLKLIAEGHSSKEIATTLVLSIKTVESHRANILSKLGMRDRVDLTRYAIRRGLIEP